jgi:hypothetical protein
MNNDPSVPPSLSDPPRKPIALPLILAFVPSVLALVIAMIGPNKHEMAAFCVPAAIVSVGCCFASSFMLFRRKTRAAIVTGILFILLNLAVTIGLGCAPVLANLDFR